MAEIFLTLMIDTKTQIQKVREHQRQQTIHTQAYDIQIEEKIKDAEKENKTTQFKDTGGKDRL